VVWRQPIHPGFGLLQLGRDADQHIFAPVVGHELDADGQALITPVERQGDGWLAGHVERHGEQAEDGAQLIGRERTDARRRLLQCRRHEQVEAGCPLLGHAHHAGREPLQRRVDLNCAERPSLLGACPGPRLHIGGRDRTPGPLAPRIESRRRPTGADNA